MDEVNLRAEPNSPRDGQTRRRILQLAGLGTVGIAGCARFGSGGTETPTEPLSTLIATWRGQDPTSTVTLQWLRDSDERADPVPVDLSQENGASNASTQTEVASFGDSHLSRHRATLTDLDADTRYRITIDESETELSVQTAPEELEEPLPFVEGGDIGTSDDVPQLHEQAAGSDPLFAVVGGDLAYADGYDSDRWIDFLEDWNEYMRSENRLIPLVAAIGDHELKEREYGGTPDDAPFFYTLFDNTQEERAYWALDIGDDISLLILDSNHTAEVAGTQTEWLEERVAERADRTNLFAVYHVPVYPSAKEIEGENRGDIREHWVPVFESSNVEVAFEHDDHAYKRTHRLRDDEPDPDDGVLYLGDGGWGEGPRDVYSPEERPYLAESESELNVIQAELDPDGSREFRAVNPDGGLIDEFDGTETQLQERFTPDTVR